MLSIWSKLASLIVGFTLINKSESIAKHTLNRFISSYSYFHPTTTTMDFIQKSLQCCGNEGPNDWEQYSRYNLNDNYYNYYNPPTSTVARTVRMPEPCCAPGSGYQYLTCDFPFPIGCLDKMYEITLQVILTMYSVALAVAVAQIVGILAAFIYAKMIRQTKSSKATLILTLQSDEVINGPAFMNYTQLDDSDQQLIQQVQ